MAYEVVNAADLPQETSASLDGTEQLIGFDTAQGKRITVNELAEYILQRKLSTLAGASQTVAAALTALNSKLVPSDTAGFHNGVYRGKDITSYLTDGTLWKRINGTNGYSLFDDLFLGDYITVGNNSYMIVDFDYYIRCCDDFNFNQHHIVMMPMNNMIIPAGTILYGTSNTLSFINTQNAGVTVTVQEAESQFKWNATMANPNSGSTAGGYKYSRMRQVIMKAANTIVVNAFGSAHVKPISVIYPSPASAEASGLASNWEWFHDDDQTSNLCKSICDLPNETQIFGQQVWSRGNAYTSMGFEVGIDKFQFALFALQRNACNTRGSWWLRSVASASFVAHIAASGAAYCTAGVTVTMGVRPRFVLVG